MIPDRQKSIAAMRTFARDLEHDRGDSPATASTSSDEVTKNEVPIVQRPTPKMAAVKATLNNVAHTTVPEHIPAFHELKKDKPVRENITVQEPAKKEKKERGITTKTPKGGGTIITDTKRERRPFFKEVMSGLSAWFASFKKDLKKTKKKTYTVTDTTRRKGVVQKATSKTGTMFSADNETLMNEIRKRQRAEKEKTDDGDEEILWSPYTESGYPLLNGTIQKPIVPTVVEKPKVVPPVSQVQNVIIQPKKRALPQPVATKPTTETPPLVDEEIVKALEQQATAAEVPTEVAYEENNFVEQEEIPPPEEIEVVREESEFREPFINGPWWKPSSFFHHDTNKLTVIIFGVLLFAVVAIFGVMSFIGNIPVEVPIVQAIELAPISSETATLQRVILTNASYNELSEKLNTAMLQSSPGSITEFVFVNEQSISVTPFTLATIIDMREGDIFAQTLTELRALKLGDGSRAILFTVDDNLNARGGLLDWELFMYEDTALMLDMTYEEELAAAFYDLTFGNHDVRVLKNGDDVLLVYGFIDAKTVVITSTLDAFIAITEL